MALAKVTIFFFAFLVLTKFNIDPDFGWHLAYGREFLEQGRIIRNDQFSWTMPGYEWGNYFFAYQVLVTFLFNLFGHFWTALIFGLLGAASIVIALPAKMSFARLLAVISGLAVVYGGFGVRPSTISFSFFVCLLLLVSKGFFRQKIHAFLWFAFFAIWANFHQGFIAGIIFLGAFLTFDFLMLRVKKRKSGALSERILCFAAAFFGTFLTPYQVGIGQGIFSDLIGLKTWMAVAEWQPIVIHFPYNFFYLISALIFIFIFFRKFKEIEPAWFFCASIFFMLAFLASNMIIFWGAIFIFLMSRNINFELKGTFFEKFPAYFSLFAVVLLIFLNFFLEFWQSLDLKNRLVLDSYPVEAAAYINKNNLGERLFNDYAWGGYLDWYYPKIKVFIDGRMTGWRRDKVYILSDYLSINLGKCEVADKYQIKTVLVRKAAPTPCFSKFEKVYEDDVAKVLVR